VPRDRLPDGFDLRLLPPRAVAGMAPDEYDAELARVQRFRGAVYLRDGAVPESALGTDGRYAAAGDEDQWQLYLPAPSGEVAACLRLVRHSAWIGPADLGCYACVGRMEQPAGRTYDAALRG